MRTMRKGANQALLDGYPQAEIASGRTGISERSRSPRRSGKAG